MIWQSGGELAWPRLRQALRMLTQRRRNELVTRAEQLFGAEVKRWAKEAADFFPEGELRPMLEGFYEAGTLRARMDAEHYVVVLHDPAQYEHFAHVRVDARLALAVPAELPRDTEPPAPEDSELLQNMTRR